MDGSTFFQNLPLPIAIVFTVYILGKAALAIVRIVAEARAKKIDAETHALQVETDAKIRIAQLEAEGKIKAAELALELARTNTEALRVANEDKAKLATDLDIYQTQADAIRHATSASLETTATAQLETVKMLGSLVTAQRQTTTSIRGSEKRLSEQVEGARGATSQSLEEFKDLFIMTFDMYMKNPPATYESIKRMQKAWAEGNMEKAQAVADEPAPVAAIADALAAVTPPAPADAPTPAEVVVADISPQAVTSIMNAVAKTDAGDGDTSEEKIAS